MSEENINYEYVLKEAQEKGFAKVGPSKNINGFDSLNKIFILSAIAFKAKINPNNRLWEVQILKYYKSYIIFAA